MTPLNSYTWPTDGIHLASLTVRVDDLASRLGLPVRTWDVDGLGPARGGGWRLPSGRVFVLEELELAVRHHRARGPVVYVDTAELAAVGAEPLVEELLGVFGLLRSDIAQTADETSRRYAAELAASVAASRLSVVTTPIRTPIRAVRRSARP